MTNLTRKNQKIFAENASNNGQFGSLQLGTKIISNDPETLQALAAYEEGWNDAVVSGEELPSLEEFQGLQYKTDYQIAYLLQKGIPEWNIDSEYFIGDIQREVGGTKIYRSITDNNIGNVLTDVVNWEELADLATLPAKATQSEVNAATDDTKFLTPLTAGLKAKPVFRAYLSAPQSIASGVTTKIQIDTEVFDTESWYDNVTNYRYTPQRAGYYEFMYFGTCDNVPAGDQFAIQIRKNGVSNARITSRVPPGETVPKLQISNLVFMNGTTDYVEVFASQNSGSNKNMRANDATDNWFAGLYIGG